MSSVAVVVVMGGSFGLGIGRWWDYSMGGGKRHSGAGRNPGVGAVALAGEVPVLQRRTFCPPEADMPSRGGHSACGGRTGGGGVVRSGGDDDSMMAQEGEDDAGAEGDDDLEEAKTRRCGR